MDRFATAGVCFAAVLLAAACGGQRESGSKENEQGAITGAEGNLSGGINVDGSSTVFPVTQRAAEQFNQTQPGVNIAVGFSGTGGGFQRFCRGETQISDASRPVDPEEANACRDAGIEFTELRVALDGITNTVNPRNDFARCLTVQQLRGIWGPGSSVNNWRQVDPTFPDRPLALFGPGPDSGTFDFFVEKILGEDATPRRDYTASEDDNVLVQGIAGNENALGYFGVAYYVENRDRLKGLGLDAGRGCVDPTDESIQSGSYPLSRPLFIYVSNRALEEEHVREFVRFYLEHSADLARQTGYVGLSQAASQETLQQFEQATAA